MKKVLWVCNIMLPAIAEKLHMPYSNREGWLSGAFERLRREESGYEVGIAFPLSEAELKSLLEAGKLELVQNLQEEGSAELAGNLQGAKGQKTVQNPPQVVGKCEVAGFSCYGFQEDLRRPEEYDLGLEQALAGILEDFAPDILHIFGTEFPHALAAVRAFGQPERTLIGIQGLCGEIAKVYMAGLPDSVQRKVALRDFLRRDSIRQQQEKFLRRGAYEAEAIRGCGNVTGRTTFDREGTARLNSRARYYAMNETMRNDFYTGRWEAQSCTPYSLFLGQGDYPLKGMHFVLMALAKLLPKYPEAKLYVAGNSVMEHGTWKERLKLPAYGKYLLRLIGQYGLEEHVIMLGKLDGAAMKKRYLDSSVFVCASVLENSPNTVGEAMLLGVPVVASRAGGIPDLLEDGREGLLFPSGDADALAEAIEKIWSKETDESGKTLAQRLSQAAAARAAITHDGETNFRRLLEIYQRMGEQQ